MLLQAISMLLNLFIILFGIFLINIYIYVQILYNLASLQGEFALHSGKSVNIRLLEPQNQAYIRNEE